VRTELTTAVSGGEAFESVLQDIVVGLRANINGLQCVVAWNNPRCVDLTAAGVSGRVDSARRDGLPINEIWSRFANCILQSTSYGEGSAYTQTQTQDTTIQLP
jgi:hypothetical protein